MSNAETFPFPAQDQTGVLFPRSEVTIADILDGTSSTYMMGEKYLNPDNYEEGSDAHDDHGIYEGQSPDNMRWCTHDLLPDGSLDPNGWHLAPQPDTPGMSIWGIFGSAHSIGVHMAFCDGSVHNINFSIDPQIHAWLGDRRDGQVIDAGSY